MNAVSLRQAGGVYFVPESGRDALFRLRQLIAGVPQSAGPGSFVCALGVPDAVEAKRSLSKAVHAGLLDEIYSLRSDLGRLGESGNCLREKTVAQRLVIYKRLKAKAEMYQDMLGIQQDQVRAGIAGLEREALNLISADDIPRDFTSRVHPAACQRDAGLVGKLNEGRELAWRSRVIDFQADIRNYSDTPPIRNRLHQPPTIRGQGPRDCCVNKLFKKDGESDIVGPEAVITEFDKFGFGHGGMWSRIPINYRYLRRKDFRRSV